MALSDASCMSCAYVCTQPHFQGDQLSVVCARKYVTLCHDGLMDDGCQRSGASEVDSVLGFLCLLCKIMLWDVPRHLQMQLF